MEKQQRDASSSPTSPRRLARFSRRVWRGYWQVFGLAGVPDRHDRSFYWPIFPVSEKTSGFWVFDPAYRCGAAPDSHRVPFNVPPRERHQQTNHKIEGCLFDVNVNVAVFHPKGVRPFAERSEKIAKDVYPHVSLLKQVKGVCSRLASVMSKLLIP
jgi:hypothetical protein